MIIRNLLRARHVGVAATAALGIGLATGGSALAAPPNTAAVENDTLTINGSSHDDAIALRLAAGAPTTLQVDFGDDGSADFSFDRTTFSSIEVSLGSGNDLLRVNPGFGDEALTIDAGSGDDTIFGGDNNATIRTDSGADVVQGGNGTEFIDSGPGDDFVDGGRGNDSAVLGPGQDAFQWDPGEGSDAIEGNSGTDTLAFNGANIAEIMSLSAEGSHAVFLRDVANIRMDMDNVEQLDLRALAGPDTITINDMTGTDFRLANIDLAAADGAGDKAVDSVTVVGTNGTDRIGVAADGSQVDVTGLPTETRISGGEPTDKLQINTGDGDDTVQFDDVVNTLMTISVA
jgi:RTX calcium-binding nonapeptide repeat (4 copies)